MKNLFLFASFIAANILANAQVNKTTLQTGKYVPPPHAGTTTPLTDADYFLTGVTVTIQTGNDNKEAKNSTVDFNFRTGGGTLVLRNFGYNNEIKANSTTSINLSECLLVDMYDKPSPFSSENTLQSYKQNGFRLDIIYNNNTFATDAWKINGVSVTLQFTAKNGAINPTYGSKTFSFLGAAGILGYRFGDNATSNGNQIRALVLTLIKEDCIDNFSSCGRTSYEFVPLEALAHF